MGNKSKESVNYGTADTELPAARPSGRSESQDARLDELLSRPCEIQRPRAVQREERSQSLVVGERPSFRRSRRQHHRHHTSVGEFLHNVGVDAREEIETVGNSLMEELNDFDSGRSSYFLDMSLMRSMSLPPDDLTEFVNESLYLEDVGIEVEPGTETEPLAEIVEGEPLPSKLEAPTEILSFKQQVTGYVLLLVAVLAVSSNGTALHLLYGVPPALKLYWRMTTTAALLSVFALKSVVWNKARPNFTSSAQWLTFGAAVIAFAAHTLLLYTALNLTTIGNAVIYGNSQALLLIVAKGLVGEPVTLMEGSSVAAAFAGAMLCSRDSEGQAEDDPTRTKASARLGDVLALASAAAGVAYLTFAKAVRPHVSVTIFMFGVMFLGSWMVLLYMLVTNVPLTLDRDPMTGLFGWMTTYNQHVLIIVWIAIVCNVLGTMGFVRAMQYFDTILIAVATLLEPMIATFIAVLFGAGLMPGILGYVGNAMVTIGTVAVVVSSAAKGEATGH